MFQKLITSESVGAGHPDKICDQISDKVLDACLKIDEDSRVACEVFASNRLIVIGGEISTKAYVDVVKLAWEVIKPLGYSENDFTIISNVNSQSADINQAVNKKNQEIGAGDQGIVYGYATDETPSYMPLAIVMAHDLVKLAEQLRVQKKFKWAKADMKSQVTIDFTNAQKPRIHTILMSIQHNENYDENKFKEYVANNIIKQIVKKYHLNNDFKMIINPSGKFVIGGPIGDTGLTGRKIIVDTYGGVAHHGGGAFSGKDYTKIDRSAAYAARWVAKNLVAANVAKQVEVQISYGIGLVEPISINIETFGSENYPIEKIVKTVNEIFDLSPSGIIKALNLKKPIYYQTSTYGHFGRSELNLPWEQLNMVDKIKKSLK